MHVVASFKQHMVYRVHVNLLVSKYKAIMFLYNQFIFFWKKLNNEEHDVSHEESGTQLDLEAECEELKTYFSTLGFVGQRELKKKVWELTLPSTTYMCPPPVKYKPKRGVKNSRKDQESDVHLDPSQ